MSVGPPDAPRIPVVYGEGPRGFEGARARVGVVPYTMAGDLAVAIVAKLGITTTDAQGRPFRGAARIAEEPPPLRREEPCRWSPSDPATLDRPDDLVPGKSAIDILIAGRAHSSEPVQRIAGRLRVAPRAEDEGRAARGGVDLGFVVASPVAARAIPIVELSALPPAPAPRPVRRAPREPHHVVDASGFSLFDAAPAGWKAPLGSIAVDAVLVASGLAEGGGDATIVLPGLAPWVTVDQGEEDVEVPMVLDTILVDADRGTIDLLFRGSVAVPEQSIHAIERITTSLDLRHRPRSARDRAADAMRGEVEWAATAGDLDPRVDEDDPRIEAARLATLGAVAPEPRMPLPEMAQVSAEIAEDPARRDEVLRRRGITPWRWMVEERAWLERFAHMSLRGDPSAATAYGELFLAAQDALGTPDEDDVRLRDYAEVRSALEGSLDPAETLEQVRWSLPRFARIERRWLRAAEADPNVREALEAYLAELSARSAGEGGG